MGFMGLRSVFKGNLKEHFDAESAYKRENFFSFEEGAYNISIIFFGK